MGKIVIKTTRKSNVSKVKVSGLNRESKKSAFYAAGIILKSIADKVDSEPEEERENGNNSD